MLKRLLQRKPVTEAVVYRLTIQPFGVTIDAPAGKALLDAALDADVLFPHNCCAGDCGTCRCRVVRGEVEEQMDTGHLIDDEEREVGWVLGCQTHPLSDVEVEIPDV